MNGFIKYLTYFRVSEMKHKNGENTVIVYFS